MTVEAGIEEFLSWLRVERGLAGATVAAYRRDLAAYAEFLAGSEPDEDLVDGFIADLHRRGFASSTIARKVAAMRGLHRFLVAEALAQTDPTIRIDAPSGGAALPKALDVDEVFGILEAPDRREPLGRRDRALLEFLYATGSRVSEAVALDVAHVDLEDRTALVTGKGSRQRLVPLGGPAVAAITAYLPDRRALLAGRADPGAMFLNSRGRRLTRQGMWALVRKHAASAGIGAEKVSPHVFRHSAATHMVQGGADLRSVQEILGHASISTTQVYTKVSPQHLIEVYVESHPRSR
jgi:integrase/recombinase XerD